MGLTPCRVLAAAMAFASMATLSNAKLVTIDDTDLTRWDYRGQWGTISKAHPCEDCQTQPDPDQVYGGTWHDLTQIGSATLSVKQATSISIFAICPGPTPDGGSYALNISVYMDGAEVSTFNSPAGGCAEYQYNYVVYQNKNLPLRDYAVQLLNLIQDTARPDSALLIDYAVIDDGQVESTTTPPTASLSGTGGDLSRTPSPQQSQSSGNSVPIVAVVIPVVVVVLLAVALLAFCLWRKRRRRDDVGQAPVPFTPHDVDARPYGAASGYAQSQYTAPSGPDMRTIGSPGYVSNTRSQYGEDTESIYSQPRATAHDPQLEAALAIIADRAARVQAPAAEPGPSVPPVPVHSAAYQAAQRPEKSRYRAQQQAPSHTAATIDRSASISHSASSGRGTTVESGDGRMQPPSYVESTVPRRR